MVTLAALLSQLPGKDKELAGAESGEFLTSSMSNRFDGIAEGARLSTSIVRCGRPDVNMARFISPERYREGTLEGSVHPAEEPSLLAEHSTLRLLR